MHSNLTVFVDYDGTITDVDTFDVLVRHYAGEGAWDDLEAQMERGEITLRTAMERQAAHVRGTLEENDALLQEHVVFDPTFPDFAKACAEHGASLTVVSSGIRPLIERALQRHGVGWLPVVAGDVHIEPDGRWRLRYPDLSPNGIHKAALVERAGGNGRRTAYVGDGRSDFDAARLADVRFAKKGEALERYLANEGFACTSFTSQREVQQALFSS